MVQLHPFLDGIAATGSYAVPALSSAATAAVLSQCSSDSQQCGDGPEPGWWPAPTSYPTRGPQPPSWEEPAEFAKSVSIWCTEWSRSGTTTDGRPLPAHDPLVCEEDSRRIDRLCHTLPSETDGGLFGC